MEMKIITTGLLVFLLSGCSAFFNIDENISQCSTTGRGKPCVSARAAYYASQGYDPDEQLAIMEEAGRNKRRNKMNTISPFSPQPIQAGSNGGGYPRPLMNQAKVMRVWINSYEDEDGNLVYPTRVFTEVEQKKWDIGYSLKRSGNKGKRVTPLVAQQPPISDKQDPPEEATKSAQTQEKPNRSVAPIPDSLPQGLIAPLQ